MQCQCTQVQNSLQLPRPRANNESSEVCGINKPGRRVKLNGSQAVNAHKLLMIRYLPTTVAFVLLIRPRAPSGDQINHPETIVIYLNRRQLGSGLIVCSSGWYTSESEAHAYRTERLISLPEFIFNFTVMKGRCELLLSIVRPTVTYWSDTRLTSFGPKFVATEFSYKKYGHVSTTQ